MINNVGSPRDDKDWNLLGVGLTAIALEMLEDDPDADKRSSSTSVIPLSMYDMSTRPIWTPELSRRITPQWR